MSDAAPKSEARRVRLLSLFDVVCIGVNAIVGSGVFALPDDMHRAMGGWSPFAYVLCGVLLLPVALCFTELAGRFEKSGGAYVYAREAFGAQVGFLVGWYCWANTFIAWAANTTLFVDLCGVHALWVQKLVCVLTIGALGAINYVGVKPGAWLVNLVTIAKVVAIACFLLVALNAAHPGTLGGALPAGLRGVGNGVYLALFPIQGFEVVSVPAAETADPKRNMPLATFGGLAFSIALFVLVQIAIVLVYPRLAEASDHPLADAAYFLGPTIGLVVAVGALVSIGGFNAGSALGAPRYAQAIADHGLLPKPLARVHDRYRTPHVAIVVTTSLAAVLAVFFDYSKLVGMSNVAVVVQYVSTCLAVTVLRPRWKEPSRGWTVPGGRFALPILGAAGSIVLVAGATPEEWAFAGASLVVGLVVAFVTKRTATRTA